MASSGEAGQPPLLTVAVDDLGTGLWGGKIKQELEARVPLRSVLFSLSRAVVSVEELHVRYLDARGDAQLQRLRQLAHSPVAWFRSPLVHVVLASCPEHDDYKRDLRLRLKAMADTDSAAAVAQPELLFVYLRPPAADPAAKGPARVFDAMRKDLNRKRERCVRLDPVVATEAGMPALLGLEEFDRQLKDALRAGFEARAAAYAEEVRRLMLNRLDPAWSFVTLFLVKDGLAAMLEAAGLLEDALREYSELEACYLETLQTGQQARQPFGGKAPGDDEAALLWAPWSAVRQAASQPELPPEWVMRQVLFASQARLLLKLHRHAEVAERGAAFVRSFGALLGAQQRSGGVPDQLSEAWAFAGYVSLAESTSRLHAARAEDRRKTDVQGRGSGRRGRASEAALQQPGSPHSGPDALPVPIPLSPASLGITSLQVRVAKSSDPEGAGSPNAAQQESQQPQLDWQLGVLPSWAALAPPPGAHSGTAGGRVGASREGAGAGGNGSASLYCLLGKLYCAARSELLRLGAAAGLDLPKAAAAAARLSEPQQHQPVPPATAAGAAAPAVLPAEAAAQREAAEAAAAAQPAPATALEGDADALSEFPSATDLAQVELDGTASSSIEEGQGEGQGDRTPISPSSDLSVTLSADQAPVAGLKLVSAPEVQTDADSEAASGVGGGAMSVAVTPRQVATAPAARLSVQLKPGADTDTPSSSPRSTSTHHSLQHAASDVQSSDAGHAVAPHPGLLTGVVSLGDHNDMRSAERQVASALSDRGSTRGSRLGPAAAAGGASPAPPEAAAAAAAGAAGAELPPWLVHWRLRAALASQALFTELFIELSEAAAKCYTQCGYLRNAALLRADVAAALAKAGDARRASWLYERQCRTFLREGWHALAAATLPKLAACQQATGSSGLAHTAAALLALPPPFAGSPAERKAAHQLLVQAAQLPGSLNSSEPLLPGGSAAGEACIDLSAAIVAAPHKAAVSRFCGRTDPVGAPLLVPPPRDLGASEATGALKAAVGDALAVQVVVNNQLPEAVPLRDVTLTLGVLQEMMVIHSPRASPRPPTLATPTARSRRSSAPGTPLLASAHSHGLEPAGSVGRERFESQWQQVEELVCSLVRVSSGAAATGSQAADGSSLRPLAGEVALPPGASVLTFLAAPVHRGLYKAMHLKARLQQLPLWISVGPPEPLWEQLEAAAAAAAAAAHSRGSMSAQARRRSSRAGVPSGEPLTPLAGGTPLARQAAQQRPSDAPAGVHAAEAILLEVDQAQPRVQLSLVAAGGSLIAGQEQWLGLALAPGRDALHAARLELTWPTGHGGGLPGLPAVTRKPPGLANHRAAHSVGGDIRLSPAASGSALATSAPPFIRPEHRSAVLLPADCAGDKGQRGEQQVVSAGGPAGPTASWLLGDGTVQQVALPTVREGRPVCLWWRVTAGEAPSPPEQVHIAPPAPRHSSRPHDARRLAGGAGEGPPPPAAVLDVPLSLEYSSGCQRSHCRVLAAPMRQPFTVASAARELPSGGVAVQFTLTSNLAVPAQIAGLALQPQPGFAVASSLLDSMGLLPASLAPSSSLTAAFLLTPEGASAAGARGGADSTAILPAKLQPSVLSVEYSVETHQQCGVAAGPLAQHSQQQAGSGSEAPADGAAPRAGEAQQQRHPVQQCTPGVEALEALGRASGVGASRSLRLGGAPGSPSAVAEECGSDGDAEGGDGASPGCIGRQACTFRHLLSLEMPATEDAASGTLVYVRLLGPFTAAVGQPTTLCWRLERGGQPDQQQAAARVAFEVQAEGDHWRPLGRRLGGVTLAGHPGAVATVEATWLPLAAGTLPVPVLRLTDVSSQEVFDVGTNGSAITVAEAAG